MTGQHGVHLARAQIPYPCRLSSLPVTAQLPSGHTERR